MAGMSIEKLTIEIEGTTAICLHCDQGADPLCRHPVFKKFKEISGKRNKTEEDHRDLAQLEWLLSLYVNTDGKLYLPGRCLESALKSAAKRQKLGKKFGEAVQVADALLRFPDEKLSIDELWECGKYYIRTGQKVGTAKVMRTTPRFNVWSAEIVITFDAKEVDRQQIVDAVTVLGSHLGMFEFRPRYGRFAVK